jgi:AraC-like DNA-binding protein
MREKLFSYSGKGISVVHTRDNAPEGVKVELHAHRNYEFYYFISGSGCYAVEGAEYSLEPGNLLVMREGEAHTAHLYGAPYERICIHFAPETMPLLETEIRELWRARPLGKGNHFKPDERSSTFISACMERLCRDSEREGYEDRARTILGMLILELYRLRQSTPIQPECESEGTATDTAEARGNAETVRRILVYINENLTTITNLDVLEQEFFFSKSYINRIFKRATGSSVWDYIVLKRLLLAHALLKEGKASIVASECGFFDYSSFYRQYRRRFGVSPQSAKKKN